MYNKTFKYKNYDLEVSYNKADAEPVNFTANRGPGNWSNVQLFPEEIMKITVATEEGDNGGQFGTGSDIALTTVWRLTAGVLSLAQYDPQTKGTNHSLVMRWEHFQKVADDIGAGQTLDESYITDVLKAL